MAKIDENKAYDLITHYYDSESSKVSTLKTFLALLDGVMEDEKVLAHAVITDNELASEGTFALLETFQQVTENGHAKGWLQCFTRKLRVGLKSFRKRQARFVDIDDTPITDPNPNPEEIYITKELVQLVKLFLHNNFDLVACDWFMRRFANGERAQEIADDYSVTTRAVNKRLIQMLPRVKRYMEKIDGN